MSTVDERGKCPLVEVSGLCKSYGKSGERLEVLRGLDLQVSKGESLAVVGASGSGKSTLLHIIGTLDHPVSGVVRHDGIDPFEMSDAELARFRNSKIGFVFQFHHLLPEFSALENVILPAAISGLDRKDAESRAECMLGEVGLKDRLHHKPGELSGGEQQRVAVARALVLQPSLLLADEPTGNLDARTGDSIHNMLLEINEKMGITMIVVTHNEKLTGRMGRVVEMVDGKLVQRR